MGTQGQVLSGQGVFQTPIKWQGPEGVCMTACSAVVPTLRQEGRWLLFPEPPVLPIEGLSHSHTQSGLHGDRAKV